MAQNCILAYSSNADGFEALKAMLKIVHPKLNNKRPSNVPPLLSEMHDIHSYEQSLRNYYLLHKMESRGSSTPTNRISPGITTFAWNADASMIAVCPTTAEIWIF